MGMKPRLATSAVMRTGRNRSIALRAPPSEVELAIPETIEVLDETIPSSTAMSNT